MTIAPSQLKQAIKETFISFYKEEKSLVPILAAKDWDINSRNYSINENIYDINSNKWVFYDTEDPYEFIYYEAYLLIFDKIEIEEDRRTKIVKITLDHASPYIAKEWLDCYFLI